jgi:ABC-type antimicrobial peptide transport system permease subunit
MDGDFEKKRFWWGVLLAWAPWVPTVVTFSYFVRGISRSKATGLAAVAGGMIEMLVLWGIVTLVIAQLAAIVWLFRSFSRDHILRSLISAASIFVSALMLTFVGTSLWIVWFRAY